MFFAWVLFTLSTILDKQCLSHIDYLGMIVLYLMTLVGIFTPLWDLSLVKEYIAKNGVCIGSVCAHMHACVYDMFEVCIVCGNVHIRDPNSTLTQLFNYSSRFKVSHPQLFMITTYIHSISRVLSIRKPQGMVHFLQLYALDLTFMIGSQNSMYDAYICSLQDLDLPSKKSITIHSQGLDGWSIQRSHGPYRPHIHNIWLSSIHEGFLVNNTFVNSIRP